MSFLHPILLAVAMVVTAAAAYGYFRIQRHRTAALTAAGFVSGQGRIRRHLPYALILTALPILLIGLARPQAEVAVPRVAGTVLLAFDISNSMSATDVAPTRLAAAQEAAAKFVEDQPETVDVGVLAFGSQALLTQTPTEDHDAAIAAIRRVKASGGTSLGEAILVGLGTITGKPVSLPAEGAPPPDAGTLGYWPSATMVVFSDGEETGGPDVQAAAEIAAAAGVRIQTVGVGTAKGGTVEVDGFQLGTALDEATLTAIAQITGGSYRPATDAGSLAASTDAIDLRLTTEREPIELTAPFAAAALLLLTLGALLSTRWHGRII